MINPNKALTMYPVAYFLINFSISAPLSLLILTP
jgi:hypothetical protein